MAKSISVEFYLDDATEKHLAIIYKEYTEKFDNVLSENDFFQMIMKDGSISFINDRLDTFSRIIKH